MSDKIDTAPAAIAAILEGVTRGPWRKDGVSVGRLPADESYVAVCVSSGTRSRLEAESNAAFIAAARDLVPALAAERDRLETAHLQVQQTLDRLSEENARLREALIWCSGSADFNEGGIAADGWQKLCAPLLKGDSHE